MGDRTGVSITTSLLIGGYFLQLPIPTKNVSSDLKALYKSVIIIIIPCSEKSTYYIVCVCVCVCNIEVIKNKEITGNISSGKQDGHDISNVILNAMHSVLNDVIDIISCMIS